MYSRRDFLKNTRDLTIGGLAAIIISSSGCTPRAKETKPIPLPSHLIDTSSRFPDLYVDDMDCINPTDGTVRINLGNLSVVDSPSFEVKLKAVYKEEDNEIYTKTYKVKAIPGGHYKFLDVQIPKEILYKTDEGEGALICEIDPNNKVKEASKGNNKIY